MTIRTTTTWTLTAYAAEIEAAKAQIAILVAEGKTDGVPTREFIDDNVIIYRDWYDSVPNAEAWRDWLYTLPNTPISVTIENIEATEPAPV